MKMGFKSAALTAGLVVLAVAAVIHSDGIHGLRPFLAVESFLFVIGGTFLLLWASFPLREVIAMESEEVVGTATHQVSRNRRG